MPSHVDHSAPSSPSLAGCRCCGTCLCEGEDTLPISGAQVKDSFELANDALLEQPAILTLPGFYGIGSKTLGSDGGSPYNKEVLTTYKRRMWLASMWAARLAAVDIHGRQRIWDSHVMEP